ncbi:hypothetical protein [Streptomyces sp. NPDC006134]|uniref:hypothetical protein n=1 Tax=Streptomyces sp. NPDC006134 TaxID=3154467 RepID=UPI0033F003A7
MAAPLTPESAPLDRWTGRTLLWWAWLLQHTVAGKDRRAAHIARRNAAMRAAYARGVDRHALVRATGLSRGQVDTALRGKPTTD